MSNSNSSSKPKSVFITGASSGIGYALAIEFAKRGYKVFAGARSVDKLQKLTQFGITIHPFDITDNESIYKIRDFIAKETGGELDILYNNAGMAPSKSSVFDQDTKDLRRTFDVNFFGHVEVIKAFQNLILKSKGLVAFTDSIVNVTAIPFGSAYASSKAALHQLGEVLALEISSLGLKVVQVITGRVDSKIDDGGSSAPPIDSIYHLDDGNILNTTFDASEATDVYAKNVVNDIEKSLRWGTLYKVTYRGKQASLAYYLNLLIPSWFWPSFVINYLKLDGAFAKIRAKIEKLKTS